MPKTPMAFMPFASERQRWANSSFRTILEMLSKAARTKRLRSVSMGNSSKRQATKPRSSSWCRCVVKTSIRPRTRLSTASRER